MYEGQLIICKDIIEDNWLEYLAFVKKQSDEELERQKKRMEALKDIDAPGTLGNGAVKATDDQYRYYDINIHAFWNWYIQHKV